jgi:hypothetical protein
VAQQNATAPANECSYNSVVGIALVTHLAIIPELMSQTSCNNTSRALAP